MKAIIAILAVSLSASISYLVGRYHGWHDARNTIASECKKIGGFYVGDEVFECKLKGREK